MVALAEEMHFHLAAKRLHMATPALSRNIRQLEDELGTQLFVRSTRSVALTSAGTSLYRDATTSLAHLEISLVNARRAAAGSVGTLTVGCTQVSIFGPMHGILRKFRLQYPDVAITMVLRPVTELIRELRAGSLDVASSEELLPGPGLAVRNFPKVDIVVALQQRHPLAASRGSISLKLLADEAFIFPPRDSSWMMVEIFTNACAKSGFRPRREIITDNAIFGGRLAAAGLGVCPMPRFCAIPHEGVVYRKITDPIVQVSPQLVWCTDRPLSSALDNFLGIN